MRRRFTNRQRNILAWVSGGVCMICGSSFKKEFHADHIRAYSKGGATTTTNGQALCAPCNLQKGAK